MTTEKDILDSSIINDEDRLKKTCDDEVVENLREGLTFITDEEMTDDDDDDNDDTSTTDENLKGDDLNEMSQMNDYSYFKEIPFVKLVTERILFAFCNIMTFIIFYLNLVTRNFNFVINDSRFRGFIANDLEFYKGGVSMVLFERRKEMNIEKAAENVTHQLAIKAMLDLISSIEPLQQEQTEEIK